MEVVWQLDSLDYWSYKFVQSSSQIITTQTTTKFFYRPDALPVTQPTVSKHWREVTQTSNITQNTHTMHKILACRTCYEYQQKKKNTIIYILVSAF